MRHLWVIWPNAMNIDQLGDEICKHCHVLGHRIVEWSDSRALGNYSRLYNIHPNEAVAKLSHCGCGSMQVYLIDSPASYDDIIEKKTKLREIAGGGHRIHCTMDEMELSRDASLIFGPSWESEIEGLVHNIWREDLAGYGGWNSIEDMLLVLGTCTPYVILRTGDDLDLLVESLPKAVSACGAQMAYQYPRVAGIVSIKGQKDIQWIDFRYVGDHYFCDSWEQDLLIRRKKDERGIWQLSEEDRHWTILYHNIYHKASPNEKQLSSIGLTTPDKEGLENYMVTNSYNVSQPSDPTVVQASVAQIPKHGLIRETLVGQSACLEFSRVWDFEEYIFKQGPGTLCSQDRLVLDLLSSYDWSPKSYLGGSEEGWSWILREKTPGLDLYDLRADINGDNITYLRSRFEEILKDLEVEGIEHRDIHPGNIILDRDSGRVTIIDWKWAAVNGEGFEKPNPLRSVFSTGNDADDFSKILSWLEEWKKEVA